MQVVLGTKNPAKRVEMLDIVRVVFPHWVVAERDDWSDVDETGDTLEANAILKATAVAANTGLPAIADDTGLEVAALDGQPGVKTARYAGPAAIPSQNRQKLLDALDGVVNRSARFRTVVAFADGSRLVTASGEISGTIATSERGVGGFGYDSIFEVDGRTFAEMGESEKHQISHRFRAIQNLANLL